MNIIVGGKLFSGVFMENPTFTPQYPAELYTKRPNSTALLSPIYDSTFKAIFTQETEESYLALKSFLSAIFEREIATVTLKSTVPATGTRKQKNMTFDVCVEFEDGEIADLEMQARNQDYDYGVRAEIQTARLLTNNAKKGKKWKAPKVYQISVLNFQYKNDDNKELRWYTLRDDLGEKLTERLNVIFIDLVTIRKQAKKKPFEKLSSLEKWGLFFSYVDHEDKKDLISRIVKSEKGIMAAKTIVKHMSKADSNWYTQNSIWIAQRDAYTIKDNAKQRIREEARAEGAKQKAEEAAIELLKEKVPVETISKCEKLPLERVLELQKSIKGKK